MIATWICRDGRRLPVGAMDDDHVRNALAMLQRSRYQTRMRPGGFTTREWARILQVELTRRERMRT